MSRRKKPPHGKRKPFAPTRNSAPKREPTDEELMEMTVTDTAAVYSCPVETADSLLRQINGELDEIDLGVTFGGAAHEIWAAQPQPPAALVEALRDYLDLSRRHLDALTSLQLRLKGLADQQQHEHIAPEPLRDIIRRHLYEQPDHD